MSLYLDTSVLLKVFFNEPESAKTAALIGREPHVTVSSLARLEALVQIQRHVAAGLVRVEMADRLRQQIEIRLQLAPFELRRCPATLIEAAERQIASPTTYCPTLDRLHLAAMEVFGVRRLLTNDDTQAAAARALGFEVILPR